MENIENIQNDWTNNQLLELKKELANEVIDRLLENNSNSIPDIPKWLMIDYLIDENTRIDIITDGILQVLWELTNLLTPTLTKYREMFSKVTTKNELEQLRTSIFNEIWWVNHISSANSKETNSSTPNKLDKPNWESSWEQEEIKKEWWKKEPTISNEKKSKKHDKTHSKENNNKTSHEVLDDKWKTYTNPISGLTYRRIDQVTDPAGKLRYPWKRSGKTVADIWCLLASGCTVTSALSPEVTLKDCFNTVRHRNANDAVEKMSNNKWKAEALLKWQSGKRNKSDCEKAKEKIIENLEKWYPAIIGARHSGIDGTNNSIVSQHYRAILGIRTQNGKREFFVGNTYNNGSWGWLKEKDIFSNMIHASRFFPNESIW